MRINGHLMGAVQNFSGDVVGFRCSECGGVFSKMWGNICNSCRENERRHQELLIAIKKGS